MALLRLIGWLLLLAALIALGGDILRSLRAGVIDTQPMGAMWYGLSPGSFTRAEAWVTAYIDRAAWDAIFRLLTMPAWLPAGFFGVVFLLVTRRRARRH